MIPVYRCRRPETAANQLLRYFQRVLVQAHYDNDIRVRFRADFVKDDRVYFAKVESQIKRWQERGGCLISWRRVDGHEGEHEAIVFSECPKSLEAVYSATRFTAKVAVIYQPPTWRPHEETIARRHVEHPSKQRRALRRLAMLRDFMTAYPFLSLQRLDRQYARLEPFQRSGARASPEGGARSPGTTRSTHGG